MVLQARGSIINDDAVELEAYFAHPIMDIKPLKFWMDRQDGPLQSLAMQFLTIPCSSSSVECLFSKAGIVLSQQRSCLQSTLIEQLLFFK